MHILEQYPYNLYKPWFVQVELEAADPDPEAV